MALLSFSVQGLGCLVLPDSLSMVLLRLQGPKILNRAPLADSYEGSSISRRVTIRAWCREIHN